MCSTISYLIKFYRYYIASIATMDITYLSFDHKVSYTYDI